MRAWKVRVSYLMLICMGLQTVAIQPALAADPIFERIFRLKKELAYHGKEPAMCGDLAIEVLAENIDWVEHHIDKYGSIVAKQPAVWGEARMTKHRDEYERMMFEQLNQFQFRINAAITQSDSSFLAQAFALSAAVEEGGDAPETDIKIASADANGQGAEPDPSGDVVAVTAKADATVSEPGLKIEGADNIGLEPTLFLDQLSRYLQHLHELRRINEGDDTSDSPGYAMNLVRIPVSMLPGKITREGFGAEVTITGTPVITEDLLPNTFRNLVVNDLVDQLALPLVKVVENAALLDTWKNHQAAREALQRVEDAFLKWNYLNTVEDRLKATRIAADVTTNTVARTAILKALDDAERAGANFGVIMEALRDHEARRLRLAGYGDEIKDEPQYAADQIAEFVFRLQLYRSSNDQNELMRSQIALRNAIISFGMQSEYPELVKEAVASRLGYAPSENIQSEITSADLEAAAMKARHLPSQYLPPVDESTEPNLTEKRSSIQKSVRSDPDAVAHAGDVIAAQDAAIGNVSAVLDEVTKVLPLIASAADELMRQGAAAPAVSVSGRARRASQPVPPSQVLDVYGLDLFYRSAIFFCPAYKGRQVRWAGEPFCTTGPDGKAQPPGEYRVDLLDVQKWLQAELAAGHELLSQPNHLQLWYDLANPRSGLASAIRSGHFTDGTTAVCSKGMSALAYCPMGAPTVVGEIIAEGPEGAFMEPPPTAGEVTPYAAGTLASTLGPNASVEAYRKFFFEQIHKHYKTCLTHEKLADPHLEVVEQMAWAIVVESALLNQRLNEDVRKVAIAKQCGCLPPTEQDLSFFLPEAAARPESGLAEELMTATQVFQEYVRCRWPIHVFAIDPREQDQNVADISRRHRELQFALALGFVSGQISARSLTQYTRELDTEIQTISLNRTAVGFSHGNDTFGWRFYPRVQALDVPGTAGTIWQSIRGTPRDADVANRQLEPGMRECVAIVLMPSFVPYVDFDVRSNWFKLTNPKNAALTMKDTMKLSRAITAMRNSRAQAAQCAHCYRVGEVERLMKRIDQLDRELPLQTMRTQIPYENTLGGFEMFNTGITDLAPELEGWYGAPGVVVTGRDLSKAYKCGCYQTCQADAPAAAFCPVNADGTPAVRALAAPPAICQGEGTTLFLVGDHLSVHDTKVIAGGVCIPHVQLVSRQIARVTIPSCVNTVEVDGKEYVAVYAATPYGVTNHLHIPVAPNPKSAEQASLEQALDSIALLQQATPVMTTKAKLTLNADCVTPGSSTVALKPTMPAEIRIDLSPGAHPSLGSGYVLMIDFGGVRSPEIPASVRSFVEGEHEAFALVLDDVVQDSIGAWLDAALPNITTTSFDANGKLAAAASLHQLTPGGLRPIAGVIPIEITLACNCCESLPKVESAAEAIPAPPAAPTPATGIPDNPQLRQSPNFPETLPSNNSSLQAAPCNCPTAASTQLMIR